jgi:hypothetical protein
MQTRRLARAFGRVVVSLLIAGIFYVGWLAVFLAAFKDRGVPVKAILWVIAPIITAAGFAVGSMVGKRMTESRWGAFFPIFLWPLVGCIVGAVSVVWFGPMLIVFGMFFVGTGSVALREVVVLDRSGDD